jgi:hydantoinase/carbamoylase family amidase
MQVSVTDGVFEILDDIAELATISAPGDGVTRLAYSDEDAAARLWFKNRCEKLGLRFDVDSLGTCFGWSQGSERQQAVLLGSHLDSVLHGGRYDGVLGVVVGFEVARRILSIDPSAALGVVSFACEEGSRFGVGAIGSRVCAEAVDIDSLERLNDLDGLPFREVLLQAGFDQLRDARLDPKRIGCFLEVHIDQGSALAATSDVGIVTAITGQIRTRISWKGQTAHSGAHSRSERRNSLLGAARFIAAAEELWEELEGAGQVATITVGRVDNWPNAANSVSGRTQVVVDLRTVDPEVLSKAQLEIQERARVAAQKTGLEVEIETLGRVEPVDMASEIVTLLQRTAEECGIRHRLLPSMAGHDAEVIAPVVPTAMLFVANPAAVSHSSEEAMSEESLASSLRLLDAAMPELLSKMEPRVPHEEVCDDEHG